MAASRKQRGAPSSEFVAFVLEQLADLADSGSSGGPHDVDARRMFGGHGIYLDDTIFAIVHGERLYFKTHETSRAKYLERGMQPFRPTARQTLKTYHEVPPEVLEDSAELVQWALEAARGGCV